MVIDDEPAVAIDIEEASEPVETGGRALGEASSKKQELIAKIKGQFRPA